MPIHASGLGTLVFAKRVSSSTLWLTWVAWPPLLALATPQETANPPPTANATASNKDDKTADRSSAASELEIVTISGTRASLQSAIERKKRAATVSDSIVAE